MCIRDRKEDGEVVFNEINTMPGFTAISMYPMLWEARGISTRELVDNLITHAKAVSYTHLQGAGGIDCDGGPEH